MLRPLLQTIFLVFWFSGNAAALELFVLLSYGLCRLLGHQIAFTAAQL